MRRIRSTARMALLLTLLSVAQGAMALPAMSGLWRTIKLKDGSCVKAQLVGGHAFNYYEDCNGQTYFPTADGCYETATPSVRLMEWQQAQTAVAHEVQGPRRVAPVTPGPDKRITFRDPGLLRGKRKGLVILVQFPDLPFQESHDATLYHRIFNAENFDEEPFKESVSDYFRAQSGGAFELDFDVVGPVTSTQEWKYYGENNTTLFGLQDKHPGQLAEEALAEAEALGLVNFNDYDWDGDGEVDQVCIIYAGFGEANSGVEDAIWQMESELAQLRPSANRSYGSGDSACVVNTFCLVNELKPIREVNDDGERVIVGSVIDGIGTFCHEFSHCMGFPDHYDTTRGYNSTSYFDIMDCGNYTGGSYLPAGYTAFEKWTCGWLDFIELTDPVEISNVRPLSEGGAAYVIYCDSMITGTLGKDADGNDVVTELIYDPDDQQNLPWTQFYTLENRQPVGCDAGLTGKGLYICHVDYHANFWNYNHVNNIVGHYRYQAVTAGETEPFRYYNERYARAIPYPYDPAFVFSDWQTLQPDSPTLEDAIESYNERMSESYERPFAFSTQPNDSLTLTSQPNLFEYVLVNHAFYHYPLPDKDLTHIVQNADGTVNFVYRHADELTGISHPLATTPAATVYNLSGQRMNANQLPRGIYVSGGRKRIVR